MISSTLANVFGGKPQKALLSEVSELRIIKGEINKARCVIELNALGEITYANDNLAKVLGWSTSEMQGQHHSRLLPPEETADAQYQTFWRNLKNNQTQPGIFKFSSQTGQTRWLQGYYAPICD
ncbi:MAG TPA: PAS domain-containing protein, partial [Methylophilus sp.]